MIFKEIVVWTFTFYLYIISAIFTVTFARNASLARNHSSTGHYDTSSTSWRQRLTIAKDYPSHFNLSYAQTKYHLSRPISRPFTCHVNNVETLGELMNAKSDYRHCSCRVTPIGTSAYTDWAFLDPCMFLLVNTDKPRTIFVRTPMLPVFAEQILPLLPAGPPFVLISGGSDPTIPRQIDTRNYPFEGFSGERPLFYAIMNSSRVLKWYAENRDVSVGYDKFATWPTGLSFATKIYPDNVKDLISVRRQHGYPKITFKPLQVLISDKLHGFSSQMHLRREVRALCNRTPYCVAPTSEKDISHREFVEDISRVSFVACVHGGGIDPSPKAWEVIMAGSIPIIQSSWLDDAYRQLPVVLVEDWDQVLFSEVLVDQLYPQYFDKINDGSITMSPSVGVPTDGTLQQKAADFYLQRLDTWRKQLAPFYEAHSAKRREVLKRLQSAYWMEQVYDTIDAYDTAHNIPTDYRVVRRARYRDVVEEGITNPIEPSSTRNEHQSKHIHPAYIAIIASLNEYPVFRLPNDISGNKTSSFHRLRIHPPKVEETTGHDKESVVSKRDSTNDINGKNIVDKKLPKSEERSNRVSDSHDSPQNGGVKSKNNNHKNEKNVKDSIKTVQKIDSPSSNKEINQNDILKNKQNNPHPQKSTPKTSKSPLSDASKQKALVLSRLIKLQQEKSVALKEKHHAKKIQPTMGK